MRLEIELVPYTSWFRNLREVVGIKNWDIIRRTAYVKYHHKCSICQQKGMLHAHEIWKYDDKKHIQTLIGIIPLCPLCHHIKHIGFAGILAEKGKLDYQEIINHFCQVNNCNANAFLKRREQAFRLWKKRSMYQWTVDLGEYKKYASI